MRRFLVLVILVTPASLSAQLSPFQEAKVRELLRVRLSCLGCHSLDGDGGRIAAPLTTVAQRRSAEYIRAIVDDPQRILPGAAMPMSRLDAQSRQLLVAYLSRGAPSGPVPVAGPAARAPNATDPRQLYGHWCASCHGVTGRGDGPNARYLPTPPAVHASARDMSELSDDALFDAIAGGGIVMGKRPRMPAFGETLAPNEIRALVAYIRTLCRCRGPGWSRDDAAR